MTTKIITEITPEQEAAIAANTQKWIDAATRVVKYDEMSAAVRRVLNEVAPKEPLHAVVLTLSPLSVCYCVAAYAVYLDKSVKLPFKRQNHEKALEAMSRELRFVDVVEALFGDSECCKNPKFQEELLKRVRQGGVIDFQWFRPSAGWLENGKIAGATGFDEDKFEMFVNWAWEVSACDIHEGVIFVSQSPKEVHWDIGGRLHNDSGPSVLFRDGFAVHSLFGMRIPDSRIVECPETMTLEEIDAIDNNDIRGIAIERWGTMKYLETKGVRVIDRRQNAIEGTLETLLEDTAGRRFLYPTCPSGKPCPPLGVPATVKTCEEAARWLAGDRKTRVIART